MTPIEAVTGAKLKVFLSRTTARGMGQARPEAQT
jgi:hypothetical protein